MNSCFRSLYRSQVHHNNRLFPRDGSKRCCLVHKINRPILRPLLTRSAAVTLSPQEKAERQEIINEAMTLTLRLYRACMRSARLIRHGNEQDEKEFQEREHKRRESMDNATTMKKSDVRFSMISMLPPVDREDELRSRYEYYLQYARENFVQESDCLLDDEWDERHISRYLHHLRRGEQHRVWLLGDMQFEDPYKDSFDVDRVDKFEKRAMLHISKLQDLSMETEENELDGSETDDETDFWDDDEDEEEEETPLPSWYKNPRSGGSGTH